MSEKLQDFVSFDVLNVLRIERSRSVYALCNLIDVCADFLQLGSHCFYVVVIQPDHIAIYEHFSRINVKTARSHLAASYVRSLRVRFAICSLFFPLRILALKICSVRDYKSFSTDSMTDKLARMQSDLTEAVAAKGKQFDHAAELAEKSARLEA